MRSLRWTLLVSILSGLLVVLLMAGVAVFSVARQGFRAQFDDTLVARAETFASLVVDEEPDENDPGGLSFDYEGSLHESRLGALISITTEEGTVVARTPAWPPGVAAADVDGDEPTLRRVALRDGTPGRHVAIRREVEPERENDDGRAVVVTVELIASTASIARVESALRSALVIGGACAVGGAGLAVWIGIGRGLAPVRRLCHDLDSVEPVVLERPERAPFPTELQPIVVAIDGMLSRLRAAMERERRFTDAAAHELRTPIAELRTLTDVAQRWPEEERFRRCIREASDVATEMEGLLESLLVVARGEEAAGPPEKVALLPLARSVTERRQEEMDRRDVACRFEGDEGASWTARRGTVLAIVRNLLDNAMEYTPDGGDFVVRAVAENGNTRFEVENGPTRLCREDAARVFEPFWRAESSRSNRRHRGLGLAIVDSLCEALQLRRTATVTGDRRLVVSVKSGMGELRAAAVATKRS